MKLIAKSVHKNKKRPSEVILVKRDGWIVTENGAFGDNGKHSDCILSTDLDILSARQQAGLTQAEMSWILGLTRSTYIRLEKNPSDLTITQYLTLKKVTELSALLPSSLI